MSLHAKINCSYFAVILTWLVTILAASAQEAPTSIRLQLTTLAWEKPIKGLYFQNAGKAEELKAYSGGFSMPFSYQGDAIIRFYSDIEILALPLEERPPPIGIAQLGPSLKHALLIFLPQGDASYQILTHDFSQQTFPTNSCRIFNFSGMRVVFAFGDKPITQAIDPNEITVIAQNDLADHNQMVKVQLAQEGQETLRLVYRSTWRFDDQARTSVFILPAPNEHGSVKMRKFVQRGLRPREEMNPY